MSTGQIDFGSMLIELVLIRAVLLLLKEDQGQIREDLGEQIVSFYMSRLQGSVLQAKEKA